MSEVTGIGFSGSDVTTSVLSRREKQYFKSVFESGQIGGEADDLSQSLTSSKKSQQVGTKLNIKV